MNDLRTAAQQALEALYQAREHVTVHTDGPWQQVENDCHAAITAIRAALAQQDEPVLVQGELPPRYVARSPIQAEPQKPEPVAKAWAEGYQQGVKDERTSEASIGIAGFGAKVEPARQNPYGTALAAEPQKPEPVESVQRKPLTEEEIDELSRTMVKGDKSVNWLCRAIERAHGIKEEK